MNFGQKIYEINLKHLNDFISNNIKSLNSKYFSVNLTYTELILISVNNYNFEDI